MLRGFLSSKSLAGEPWLILLSALALTLLRCVFPETDLPLVSQGVAALGFTLLAAFLTWRHRHAAVDDARRDPALLFLAVLLGILLMTLLSHRHRFWGDGIHHYTYLVSVMEDGDLQFENNARDLAGGEPSGTYTHYSIGPAFIWLPGYLVAELGSRLTGRSPDGWNALYRNAAALSSLLVGWSGLVALYWSGRALVSQGAALLATVSIGAGTFLIGYLAFAPTESHASTFGCAAWLVHVVSRVDLLRPSRAFLVGALLGFAAIQRWQAAVLALFVGIAFVRAVWERRGAAWSPSALACATGVVLLFAPQAIVWKSVFGSWLTIPQGAAFVSSDLRVEGVLFSPRHGLFAWSPLLYLAVPGFVTLARRRPWLFASAILVFVATVRTNAGLADWSGGAAFGARRFDLVLPFFTLALAFTIEALAEQVRKRPYTAISALLLAFLLWNGLFARAYFGGVLSIAETVPFVDQASAVTHELDGVIGSPASLPAALFRFVAEGEPLAEFEGRYLDRLYSTITLRMGLEDRLFLDDGWSAPVVVDGMSARRIEAGAGVHLPIHRPRPYRLGLRCRATSPGVTFELWINDRRVGAFAAGQTWKEYESDVPAEILRAERNSLRIAVNRTGERSPLEVAGVWFDPR